MQRIQMNTNGFRKALMALVCLGLLLCGCADHKEDTWFLEETEILAEVGNAETGEQDQAVVLEKAAVGNGIDTGEKAKLSEEMDLETEPDGTGEQAAVCIVHICGAVKAPGVYELPEGSRVMDAVEAGGGFLEEADQAACNLAQPVTDGCQIYIMTKEESSKLEETVKSAGIQDAKEASAFGNAQMAGQSGAGQEATADGDSFGKVNLNTADASVLKTLPGIGDSRAAAIIAYRQQHGQFTRIEDIMKVSGIKEAAFEKIKDRITV